MAATKGTSNLNFTFRGESVPVTHCSSVSSSSALAAIQSKPFVTWYQRCEKPSKNGKTIQIHSVEIQSVDMFGSRVGFLKIQSHATLHDSEHQTSHPLPGICFLRGDGVAVLVALFCSQDDNNEKAAYAILVDQPRVPIGQASTLELPAGMLDGETVAGAAIQELQEECGIKVKAADLVDLTALACDEAVTSGSLPIAAVPPSPGGCDEFIQYMYLEKRVTRQELADLQGRLTGLREDGEYISLRIVPLSDVWRVSGDAKAMICLFLLEQLRGEGRLPPAGELATPLSADPTLRLSTGAYMPRLAFGLYKVPKEDGEKVVLDAIAAGYRHFDSAPIYGNEEMLGRALARSSVRRRELFITSKIWNDAVQEGRVRESVEKSLKDVGCDYFDLFLIHWPVPGAFVAAYRELEELHKEGKLKAIGLSNFTSEDYNKLQRSGISVAPAVNQIEVSPMMYRKHDIDFFQERDIVVYAHKALNRANSLSRPEIAELASKYSVTSPQIMIRWGFQKGMAMAVKTVNPSRMAENRAISNFSLSSDDMATLDSLTTPEDIAARRDLESVRKVST